jgi:hypothetical protein
LFEAYAEPKGYNLTRIAVNKFDVSWLGFSREDDLVAFKFRLIDAAREAVQLLRDGALTHEMIGAPSLEISGPPYPWTQRRRDDRRID